jgi:hypothetical protein
VIEGREIGQLFCLTWHFSLEKRRRSGLIVAARGSLPSAPV